MSVDMFMKVEGASGESKDARHPGWSDIESFLWGARQPHSMASGGGAGVGKVCFDELVVMAFIDKAYPGIVKHCATGQHLGQVELSLCKAGGSQMEYIRITLTDALVTHTRISGAGSQAALRVEYRFQAAKIKTQYWEQTQQGGRGAESQMGFSIKENRET